jgi:glycerol kinase
VGYWDNVEQIADNWEVERTYTPQIPAERSQQLYQGWQEAVRRASGWAMEQDS